ncbi:MAG: hypothetical protein J7M15_04125 [Anaerolineae bacterium]|nr:hypothetical protein [Anaerolineae bacterium]
MLICSGTGVGDGVGVDVGLGVGVAVAVHVGTAVAVDVAVAVGLGVSVAVGATKGAAIEHAVKANAANTQDARVTIAATRRTSQGLHRRGLFGGWCALGACVTACP